MVDNVNASQTRSHGSRLGRALLMTGVLAVVLFDFWLIANQDMIAMDPDDDPWFLQKAKCGYWFDEGYSIYSFIFQPVYPLWVAACYRLSLPLRLANEALYLAAAGFLSWSLVYRQTRADIGLLVFAAIALLPTHYLMLSRLHPNSICPSLLMLALGALFLQLKLWSVSGCWWRRLGSGLALGLLWNARPEHAWMLGVILVFLAATAVNAWRRHPAWATRIRSWLGEWSLPMGVLAAITLAIMIANYVRWGVFAVTDLEAPGFAAAQRALMRIKPEHPVRYVPVTQDALNRAYLVSPSFRELAPHLDENHAPDFEYQGVPAGEYIAGMFFWCLREAAAAAGHCRSACDSETYYRRVADELNTAAAEGRLSIRWVPFTTYVGIDPCLDNWLPSLIPSCRKLWSELWKVDTTAPGDWRPPVDWHDPVAYPGPYAQLMDLVACRRPMSRAPGVQSRIRELMCTGCSEVMYAALASAGLVALAVVLLRRAAPGWGLYLLTGVAFGITGLLQFGLLVVADAALFQTNYPRYMFPAALTFTILAVWLLADGTRLLSGAFAKSFQGSPGDVQARGPRGWIAPGKRYNFLIVSLTSAAVLFLILHSVCGLYRVYQEEPGADSVEASIDYSEIAVPVVPVEVSQMTWKDGKGRGNDPYLVFALQQTQLLGQDPRLVYDVKTPLPVSGIRLRYTYEDTAVGAAPTYFDPAVARGPAFFQLFWRRSDRDDFGLHKWWFRWLDVGRGEQTMTIWVNDTIDEFRIHPDNKPCVFRLSEITLLVPVAEASQVTKPVLATPFARARAAEPVTVDACDRKQVLRVPAPSTVDFDIPARSRRTCISGTFGILPCAYANPQDHTDGVTFTVEYAPEGEKTLRVLFKRFLDPHNRPEDRGMQEFGVWLPAGEKGKVVLRASNPSGMTNPLDWSYWTDVDIEGARHDPGNGSAVQPSSGGDSVEGQVDGITDEGIAGWAWDLKQPDSPIRVDIYDGEDLMATVVADQFREDLLKAKVGNGRHSFDYRFSRCLRDGTAHTIRVMISGTKCELAKKRLVLGPESKRDSYETLVQKIRDVVRRTLPAEATVVVVSKGDDDLLKLDQRKGWHFLRDKDGPYAGHPADSNEAITHLEAMRANGGQFLLLPEPAFWWLDHYKEFKQHLESRYQRVHADPNCIIYQLTKPARN
jgi:hypothetical protein